ncbi:hypothetical protein COLO4_19616 [Corchorus olitorius]|uniref:Uncharacterized protein n=1 Tax=Corchorus olitorius TaxID=93759 RepID=A0A1R3J4G1_9ROSI|nr:hypothetical protein COLO4_19616 [Corchorus olitorius]
MAIGFPGEIINPLWLNPQTQILLLKLGRQSSAASCY